MSSAPDRLISRIRMPNIILFLLMFFLIGFHTAGFTAQDSTLNIARISVKDFTDNKNNGPDIITEDQVIKLVQQNSRQLKCLTTRDQVEEFRVKSSGWFQNPELRLSEESDRYMSNDYKELELGLRWRLPRPGELGKEKQNARVRLWEQKVETIRHQQRIIFKIRKEYANVLMYDAIAQLEKQRLDKEKERLDIIDSLVKLGQRTIVYSIKAKIWEAESENDFVCVKNNQGLARRKLANQTGIPENAMLAPQDIPEYTPDVNQLIEIAFNYRPEMELVEQRIELAKRQNKFEKFKLIPWPTFIESSYHIEDKHDKNWNEFRIGLSLPLFNWNRGNIKATNLSVQNKECEYESIRETIKDDVHSAFIIYQELLSDWQNFKKSSDELISNVEKLLEQTENHETIMPDEILEMELAVIKTKKLLCEKKCNLCHALYDLYYAIGIGNDGNVNNEWTRINAQ